MGLVVEPKKWHTPVMPEEVKDLLITEKNGIYIDGTLGAGGHAEEITKALGENAVYIGIDRDSEAIEISKRRLAGSKVAIKYYEGNYTLMSNAISELQIDKVDGVLLDLGVSSGQIDTAGRGFSFGADGPLDMRMNKTDGETAADLIAQLSEEELSDIIHNYGEERYARKIANGIVRSRKEGAIETTDQLAAVVNRVVKGDKKVKSLARVFQAFRIAVNDELSGLENALVSALSILKTGGRIVVISYHSLEDRIVKNYFRDSSKDCVCPPGLPVCVCDHERTVKLITRKVVKPTEAEIKSNPRSRSARLRAAERV